eukprot:3994708-Amphidinium_carterae.1
MLSLSIQSCTHCESWFEWSTLIVWLRLAADCHEIPSIVLLLWKQRKILPEVPQSAAVSIDFSI